MDNFGVITIEEGEIDEEGILENLRELFDKDWAWQLKKSDDYKYIVRFPPDRKVEKLVIGKASVFDLNRPGVVGSLSVWNGEIEPIGSLVDVWVQILGIPPKWVDWKTLHEVSSSIGRMVETDWQLMFNSFFSSVRVKVQCKDPTKIPRERLFVFKNKVHLIVFNPEGYEADNPSEGGSGKGGGEEKKGDDPLGDDELSDTGKGDDEAPKEKEKDNTQGHSATKTQGSNSAPAGGKSVKRVLLFDDLEVGSQNETMKCVELLKAMELDEDDEGVGDEMGFTLHSEIQEDDESYQLLEEWVFYLIEQRQESQVTVSNLGSENNLGQINPVRNEDTEPSVQAMTAEDNRSFSTANSTETVLDMQKMETELQKGKKGGKKPKWGPVIPLRRSSRNVDNGKLMMGKAQEAKRKWNLDDRTGIPTKNSKVSKPLLLSVAKDIGLEILDGDPDLVECMVQLDCSRNADSKLNCTHTSCSKSLSPSKECLADPGSSSRENQNLDLYCQDGNADNQETDQEAGWSKVGPKKKSKKHRK